MADYLMHECPNKPVGHLQSLQRLYGYPEDETRIPLNREAGGETGHAWTDPKTGETKQGCCPYCGMDYEDMEKAQPKIGNILRRRPGRWEESSR